MKAQPLAYTTDYTEESTGISDIERTIREISEACLTHIHWYHERDGFAKIVAKSPYQLPPVIVKW